MQEFLDSIKNAVNYFTKINKPVRVISHLDADGLTSAAIITKAFLRKNIKFSLSVVRHINNTILNELKMENYNVFFFIDMGADHLKDIENYLEGRLIFVLDHHKFNYAGKKAIHVNPNIFNLNYNEISSAGIVYLFARCLDNNNTDLAYIALIGAVGDMQCQNNFVGLNRLILEDAINSGMIEVKKGLKIFGVQNKPLYKVLEHSMDPYMPGVSGSEEGAIKFLNDIGIEVKKDGKYKKLNGLNEEELKKLITGIIINRLGSEENPEDIFGDFYLLKEGFVIRNIREFSTLLNACGRLNKPSIGVGACLGIEAVKDGAVNLLEDYKKEIIKALNWFHENKKNKKLIEGNGYVIINMGYNVRDSMVGPITSMISNSNIYDKGATIVVMANTPNNEIKVSLRVSGNLDIDLRTLLKDAVGMIGDYSCGGHNAACGALIPLDKEEVFIKNIKNRLDNIMVKPR